MARQIHAVMTPPRNPARRQIGAQDDLSVRRVTPPGVLRRCRPRAGVDGLGAGPGPGSKHSDILESGMPTGDTKASVDFSR